MNPKPSPEPEVKAANSTSGNDRDALVSALEVGDLKAALGAFAQLHPSDQADALANLDASAQRRLLEGLNPAATADVMEQLEPGLAVELSGEIPTDQLADVLDEARPDVAADVLRGLPDEVAEPTLEAMEASSDVETLLAYDDKTAGGHMTTRFVSVDRESTIAKALDVLRFSEPDLSDAGTVFVTDKGGVLVGRIGIAALALGRPSHLVSDAMDERIHSVGVDVDQEDCAQLMSRYDLDRLAVVDSRGLLVGVIRDDDLVDVVVEEATEDIYRLAGMGDERVFGSMRLSVRHRLPWLYVNLATVLVAAAVIGAFESTIAQFAILAAFVPVVMGQGGISGVQTMTLVVRALTLGEVEPRHGVRLFAREAALGILHGAAVGLCLGIVLGLWKGNMALAVVIGVATLGTMVVGAIFGALVPLALRRVGVDPALASATVVTTATDVFGALISLGMAAGLIGWLL